MESFTRLHHYYQYGLFWPLYRGVIHYSGKSLELSKIATRPKLAVTDYQIILSGASVACSYGIQNLQHHLSTLIEKGSALKVRESCQEGYNLNQEILALQKLNPKQKTIIFLSGFNDAFIIDN
ncbi:hypothetical protein MJH12_11565, partial [bacterium]|nr:hypothetical protein [bacterium]